jgi:hypothetical protein
MCRVETEVPSTICSFFEVYFLAEEVEWFIALFVQLAGLDWQHAQSASESQA